MNVAQPAADQPFASERNLWMPPGRLLRYQLVKIGAAAIALAIFGVWMTLRWHVPMMRWLSLALAAMTVWFIGRSIVTDIVRARGRQLELVDGALRGIRPGEPMFEVRVADIAEARWRDDTLETLGLWLFDRDGRTLVQLDGGFIADEMEARDFLRWARQRVKLDFPVRWPARV